MNNIFIHISKLTLNDLPELRALSIETFYESFIHGNTTENMQHYIDNYFSEEKLSDELCNNNSAFYFALLNGAAIGYLKINWGNAQTELRNDAGFEIERIYVKKEFQGKKTGQLLFDKALQVATELGVDYLWLGVWEKNPGAIKFYERNGLQKFASHPFKLGDDIQTDILMKISLK
jgi:ribosomal protein S18 acetylase RimI-like enzyme